MKMADKSVWVKKQNTNSSVWLHFSLLATEDGVVENEPRQACVQGMREMA